MTRAFLWLAIVGFALYGASQLAAGQTRTGAASVLLALVNYLLLA